MRSVTDYLNECVEKASPLPPFSVGLADAVGCLLAEDIRSTVDVPPAHLAACDGYALSASDIRGARPDSPAKLPVTGEVFASSTAIERHTPGTAMKVASGARLPIGADAVVPLESTNRGIVEVEVRDAVEAGSHVRRTAEDMKAGEVVLTEGTRLSSRHIAVLAATGRDRVLVHPAPRVVIMSVGDELVEPGQGLAPGQVYDANSHALASAVQSAGGEVFRVGAVSDDQETLRNAIEDQLVRADILILSGGLSYGGGDTVKEVLSPLGSVRFDNIAMSPGRQLGFGTLNEGDVLIFCLPGDPVSALVAFEVFVRPSLRKMAGYTHLMSRSIHAKATRGFAANPGRRDFVRVSISGSPAEGYVFTPVGEARHPILRGYAEANGLAVVPEDVEAVGIGDELACMVLSG